ncbi:MAG TPA: membrane protein insertion efficiency factor YidD [Terracidiphilus sp.]|jgi:putative membrane protein insertion efficiency factor|nr:membrane protein insertion efficiency factor YidD [Terracidiphilus sp.]
MTSILLALLALYRRWVSPALHSLSPGGCKFEPTCSEYAQIAIATHGPLRGTGLALWRLLRCHPFSPGGVDPVPLIPCNHDFAPGAAANSPAQPTPFPREPLP